MAGPAPPPAVGGGGGGGGGGELSSPPSPQCVPTADAQHCVGLVLDMDRCPVIVYLLCIYCDFKYKRASLHSYAARPEANPGDQRQQLLRRRPGPVEPGCGLREAQREQESREGKRARGRAQRQGSG